MAVAILPPLITVAEHELVVAQRDALRAVLLELVRAHDDKQFVSHKIQKLWVKALVMLEESP